MLIGYAVYMLFAYNTCTLTLLWDQRVVYMYSSLETSHSSVLAQNTPTIVCAVCFKLDPGEIKMHG